MKLNTFLLLIVLPSFFYHSANAQKPSSLFVHYDKTVYTGNETIWFTAYLLKSEVDILKHNLLSVALINEDNRRLALEERFVMKEGYAHGNMRLPDTIPPGSYYLVAYTNMKKDSIPLAEYIQYITIKTAANQTYELTAKVLDTAATPGEIHVLLNTRNAVFQRIPDADLSYTIGRAKAVSAKTNKQGQYLIKIPKAKIGPLSNILTVEMRHEKESKNLSLQLPYQKAALQVGFYPEGGNLVANLENKVSLEAKLSDGQPLSLTAIVFDGTVPIDTVQTSGYGVGQFKFRPKAEGNYYVKLKGVFPNAIVQQRYPLPKVHSEGLILGAEESVVEDTLNIQIASLESRRVVVKIQKEERVLAEVQLNVGPKKRPVKVDLTKMPRGLTTITVYDMQGTPLAERIFFAHFNKKAALNIETSSATYKPREKINLKLSMGDQGGTEGLAGLVSIACVQSNRLEPLKQSNIENYFYLEEQLTALPVNSLGKVNLNKRYLEDILLTKGWRKYTANPAGGQTSYNSAEFTGLMTRSGKPVKKATSLTLVGERMQHLEGDSTGVFKFNNSDLSVIDNKKLHFFISNDDSKSLTFEFVDPFKPINSFYSRTNYQRPLKPYTGEQSSEINVLKDKEKVIRLEEVVIRAGKVSAANECGDFVCSYNVLNCSHHGSGKPAIVGKRYKINGVLSNYFGCVPEQKNTTAVKGINFTKEYYGSDYAVFNPTEGEYISTIYWKYALQVKKDVQEIGFYASDITGKFKVIVQGVTNSGVVYAEREFEVKK